MKIYFAGSIRAGRDNQQFSEKAISEISKYAEVLTEHVGDPNLSVYGEEKTEDYIYSRDMKWLEESDAVIAEVTTPSLGVGYEIAYAESWNKPVLCLFNNDYNKSKLSAMLVGSSLQQNSNITVMYYKDISELGEIIKDFMDRLGEIIDK